MLLSVFLSAFVNMYIGFLGGDYAYVFHLFQYRLDCIQKIFDFIGGVNDFPSMVTKF